MYAHTLTHIHTGISDASSKILLNCNSSVVCQTQWATSYLSATKGYKPIGKYSRPVGIVKHFDLGKKKGGWKELLIHEGKSS